MKAEQRVCEAEKGKARIYEVTGKTCTSRIDEEFMLVGANVNKSVQEKIIAGQYVNFAHLLPKDRIAEEEEKKYELVNDNGKPAWIPQVDKDLMSINSLLKMGPGV